MAELDADEASAKWAELGFIGWLVGGGPGVHYIFKFICLILFSQ